MTWRCIAIDAGIEEVLRIMMYAMRRLSLVAAVVSVFVASGHDPLSAAETKTGELLSNVKKEADAGHKAKALDAAFTLLEHLWDEAPLRIRKADLITTAPDKYGSYQPRDDLTYRQDENLIAYFEPYGYGYRKMGNLFLFSFIIEVNVRNRSGDIVMHHATKPCKFSSRRPNKEIFLSLGGALDRFKPGKHTFEYTVHDLHGAGSDTKAFTIRIE